MSERILNWCIFVVCVFITIICFINTGMLWPVVPDTQDVIDLNDGYINFVKIMNLIFGFIFFIFSGVFLIRALSTLKSSRFDWARNIMKNKYFEKLNVLRTKNKELDIDIEATNKRNETLRLELQAKKDAGEIIPANYAGGRFVEYPVSNPTDKIPVIAGKPLAVPENIDLGDFSFKGTTTATTGASTSASTVKAKNPLDSLKAYYVSQNLQRRNR